MGDLMWCLVFWKKEKTRTVMKESEELKNIDEGEEVELYVEKKPYKAVLLARSGKHLFQYYKHYKFIFLTFNI